MMAPAKPGAKPIHVWWEVHGRTAVALCSASGTTRAIEKRRCLTPWTARLWAIRRVHHAVRTVTRSGYTVIRSNPNH